MLTLTSSRYDHDPDALYRFLSDPDRVRERCEALGERDVRVTRVGDTVTTVRVVDAEVPGFVKKLFKPSNLVTDVAHWDPATRSMSLRVDIKGVPVAVTGTLAIEGTEGGARVRARYDVKVRVPLVGSALARHVARLIEQGFERETQWNQKRLAELAAAAAADEPARGDDG